MNEASTSSLLRFDKDKVRARFVDPDGQLVERTVEIRMHPLSGRTCRVAYSRALEREAGTSQLPPPPPHATETDKCPFCRPQLQDHTPRLAPSWNSGARLQRGDSVLFPNLFPYGSYSAVSLFDDRHFVEIGHADVDSYTDCLINCSRYLDQVLAHDSKACYMAITQNHLPSAGGSLLHPHLQVHADRIAPNHHRFLHNCCAQYRQKTQRRLFSDYLQHERRKGDRYIGATGSWHWMAAFAPEGFYELWAILSGITSLRQLGAQHWHELADGVIRMQRFYRSLNRNGYNLGLLTIENGQEVMELRLVAMVRSNYAPWVRNDHTGYEVMLGDMVTFTAPEEIAAAAKPFWKDGYDGC